LGSRFNSISSNQKISWNVPNGLINQQRRLFNFCRKTSGSNFVDHIGFVWISGFGPKTESAFNDVGVGIELGDS
jgi:hypothetical protein